MTLAYQTFVLVVFVCEILSSEVPRPRGVSLSRASLYTPDKQFTCFDNSKSIPFQQVNDDYCDCLDASDEPGTSACPHGTFHCTNSGHRSLNLASNRVNDGICDCCDGSDEYTSKTTCSNNCLELGRAAREEEIKLAELVKIGKEIKVEMIEKGVQMKRDKQAKLTELEKTHEEALKLRNEKELLKKEAEEYENVALEYYRKLEEEEKARQTEIEQEKNKNEALQTFSTFDSNQDGFVDLSELQTRQTFDKDKNGEVSEEEARYFLNNEEKLDVDKFVESAWSNIKPFLMMDEGMFKPPTTTEEEEEEEEQTDGGDVETTEDIEEEDEQQPEAIQHDDHNIQYDEQTQKLVEKATEARNAFSQVDKQTRDIENEIKSIQEYLTKDLGAEEEFAVLEGECFEYADHEYVYKLCPFDKTSQQPKSSGSETRLGTWGRWEGGENDNKYSTMLYDRGQSCWNGPQRSTLVKITCGSENRVIGVSEPNRCEYVFDFTTPAACRDAVNDVNDDLHDEL